MRQDRVMNTRSTARLLRFAASLTLGAALFGGALPARGEDLPAVPEIPSCAAINARKITLVNGSAKIAGSVLTLESGRDQWATSVLDPMHRLPSTYVPTELVAIDYRARQGMGGGWRLKAEAAGALRQMFLDSWVEGIKLRVISAYRSYATQKITFTYWVTKSGLQEARHYSAVPGHSEHQLGTAVDLGTVGAGAPWGTKAFATSPTAQWLTANAYRYGFVRSYPSGAPNVALSCYGSEPWHWRYVGATLAYEITCSELVPRIFLWGRQYGGERTIGTKCGALTPPEGYEGEVPPPIESPAPTESPAPSP